LTLKHSHKDTPNGTSAAGEIAGVKNAPGVVDPDPSQRYNLVVIGGGTAGQACASGAAALGARVALIEKAALGGDSLRYGTIPSKALVDIARTAHDLRRAAELGLSPRGGLDVDLAAVMRHVGEVRTRAAARHNQQLLLDRGVDLFFGDAHFEGPGKIGVDGKVLHYARAIIATGARPRIPEIPGLDRTRYLTCETVFELTELPRRLAIIGAGRVGCELAQAFARFGSDVTLFDTRDQCLGGEDADAATVVQAALEREGVTFRLGSSDLHIRATNGDHAVHSQVGNRGFVDPFDRVLIAIGRVARTGSLNLEKVGVVTDDVGIRVNPFLRTSNWHIFAAGDCCSEYRSTHAADALARVAIANSLFFGTDRTNALLVPTCVLTDPQVAHVGLYPQEADAHHLSTLTLPLADLDATLLDGCQDGFLKVHHDPHGHIKGATLVCRHAAELVGELVVAMNHNVRLGGLAADIHTYPTESEIFKRAGDFYRRGLVTPAVGRLLKKILEWRR
jgi:pyruvate/2-oxoglutarate dehydrogenase complex dihydrolipoamide dehydrogenase (E3) component